VLPTYCIIFMEYTTTSLNHPLMRTCLLWKRPWGNDWQQPKVWRSHDRKNKKSQLDIRAYSQKLLVHGLWTI